jgi:hypothetical protein
MSGVPYTFATATTSIPLTQLDVNFATNATLGNATVGLGNTTTVVGNLTLQNVTISSVASAITPAEGGTGLTSPGTSGNVLTSNGTVWISQAPAGGVSNATSTVVGGVVGNTSVSATLVALGYQAGNSTTGVNNTAIGYQSLYSNIDAGSSTALGYQSLYTSNSSGCTSVGYQSGYSNTSGSVTSFGYRANYSNTTGSSNTAIGQSALYANTTGNNNTAVGYQAGNVITTGGSNTSLGQGAHNLLTTGNNNIAIGQGSGQNIVSGYQTIYIGSQAYASSGSVNNEICIATYLAAGKGSQTAYLDSNGSTGAGGSYYNGANSSSWNTTSDQRLKKNIVDNTVGLEKINQLKVRNFEYRLPEEVDPTLKPSDAIIKDGLQLGFIAQELQAVLPDCVKEESTGVMSINTENVLYHLVNAVKELSATVTTQAAQIAALQAKVGV